MSASTRRRLSRDDWLAAGLEAPASQGAPPPGAEPLARQLGTTKGSFYWHFRDVPDYHAALLAAWAERATPDPAGATAGVSPAGRLRELLGDTGIGNPEMARIIYAARLGLRELDETEEGENARAAGSLVDLILALR